MRNTGIDGVDGHSLNLDRVFENRRAHIDGGHKVSVPVVISSDRKNACQSLNLECLGLCVFFICGIFCKTADTVSAHLSLASVRLEQRHLHIGFCRRTDEKNTVCTDSKASVAVCDRKPCLHIIRNNNTVHFINQDEIVSVSVKLGK